MKNRRLFATVILSLVPAFSAIGDEPERPAMLWGDSTRLGRPFAKDPCVIRIGAKYRMYFSIAPFAPDRRPPDAPAGWGIGIADSEDLIHWTKVGDILPVQDCEQNGLVNGRVIRLQGRYHLFYNTYGNGPRDALCHATSEDGLAFVRDRSNPIWRPTGTWNNGRAIDVDVVEFQGKLLLYYATRDPSGRDQLLHVIAADPRSDFSRDAWSSFSDGPVLRPELPWETRCIEAPSLVVRGDKLFLFYGGGYNNDPQQIGCAVSRDGIRFERLFVDRPLLPHGAPGSWNASESGHPGYFRDDDGQEYLFYQGNNDRGRTWFLSWVKIGWQNGRPFVHADR